ncbi:MAG: hypothetical protein E3J60_03865 [Dehalococcoidia bacterium]|nr:MAG: hypothetical protein E3J60_03865 [Dehalococcoidia bacterium]
MNSKQYVIEKMEELLRSEEEKLSDCRRDLKIWRNEVGDLEGKSMGFISNIAGLKDALHKLKGLDNLEKKNKITDPVELEKESIEWKRPASMTKNLLRTETAILYGRSIASYSRRELAAYVIHQSDRIKELLERSVLK